MYADNELLFPEHVIPMLRDVRGEKWEALVRRVAKLPEIHEEKLAFMLVMIRLNGCMSCETDSYRAMRGCAGCALQTLRRFKGDDDELLAMHQSAVNDVCAFAHKHPHLDIELRHDTDSLPA